MSISASILAISATAVIVLVRLALGSGWDFPLSSVVLRLLVEPGYILNFAHENLKLGYYKIRQYEHTTYEAGGLTSTNLNDLSKSYPYDVELTSIH